MGIQGYEIGADGSDYDETAHNDFAVALGRIPADSLNPRKAYDYIVWVDGLTYYAQNGATGVVTSNAACHTLINGLLDDNVSIKVIGQGTGYSLTGAINFADYSSASIYGDPKIGTMFQPADTINAFEFDENWNCVLQDIKIYGNLQTTSGMGLMFTEATGTNYAFRNMIRNIEFHECYIGIGDLNAGTNASAANLFQDITMFDSTFSDVRLNVNGTGFWRFNRCTFDHITTQASDDYSFRITGADGIVLDTVSWLMGGALSKGGAHIEDTDFIWMSNCDMEKAGLSGMVFKNSRFGKCSNLRIDESGMRVAAAGEASLKMLGCSDWSFTNTGLNITTGATNIPLRVFTDFGTECTYITFMGGHVSNSTGYGCSVASASSNIKFLGVNFHDNADDDVSESGTTNYNTYKGCNMNSGVGWTFIGSNNTYDRHVLSDEIDLTGGAVDIPTFFAGTDCVLTGYRIFYTVATGAGAVKTIRVGHYADGVALDNDYYDISNSEQNEGIGHEAFFRTADLTLQAIPAGHVVTVGTEGGKADTGKFKIVLSIIENAS